MALIAAVGITHAGEVLTRQDKALIEQGRAIGETARTLRQPSWIKNRHVDQAQAEARRFYQELQATNPTLQEMKKRQAEKGIYTAHTVLVFASYSLGEQGLDDVLSAAASNTDAVVVFRGIPEGMSLGEGVKAIQDLAAAKDPVPNIIINPTMFKTHNVQAVPTIVMLEEESFPEAEPKVLARVEGLSNPAWLVREVEHGASGDQGVRGPVAEIAEPDLIEVMKARVAQIDWNKKKEQAKARFWTKQRFYKLPRAPRGRTRAIDPSIYITEDIRAPDGTLIAAQGSVINPLEIRGFTQAAVIFDPLDKKQMELLASELPAIQKEPGVQRITYIATRFERDSGWESYKQVTDTFDAPVYLLTPDLISRFKLAYTPSVITSRSNQFIVRELAQEKDE